MTTIVLHKKIVKPRQAIAELDDDVDSSHDGEVITDITSSPSTEYISSAALHATASTSTMSAAATSTSLLPPNPSGEQFHAMPGVIIIGVVVGVVAIILGVGLFLGERRRRRAGIEEHETLSSLRTFSHENGDSAYILQRAQTKSVEVKRGVLISIPSRGRVS